MRCAAVLPASESRLLPYGQQLIDEDDIAAVASVLRSGYLTTGDQIPAFESDFAKFVNAPHAVACSSGTAGLHLACRAIGLEPGDQVIVPTVSFVATANCARYCGAEVIFCDVDPSSGLATPETVSAAIARTRKGKLKAVFVVHLTGAAADIKGISNVVRTTGAALVEDACHAIGTRYAHSSGVKGHVGDAEFSDCAVFSFHPVKTMTTGEGGMVTTQDAGLAERMALARNHGLVRNPEDWLCPDIGVDKESGEANPWAYELQDIGYNYRLTDFQAALGRSQLRKLPGFAEKRRRLVEAYQSRAGNTGCFQWAGSVSCEEAVHHLIVALIDFRQVGLARREVMLALRAKGIGTQVHYIPIHLQPYYAAVSATPELPGSLDYYARCLSLPLFAGMSEENVDDVCSALNGLLGAG